MSDKNTPNWRRHGKRYKARRRAVDILFEAEARDVDPVAIVEDRVELSRNPDYQIAPVADYTRTLVAGVAEELDYVDDLIVRYLSDDWELDRLPAVDRAILRMSTWEILFNDDVPTVTGVVEGVELASEYSHDKAAPYVHAVLDAMAQNKDELKAAYAAGTGEGEAEPEEASETPAAETAEVPVPPAEPEHPEVAEPTELAEAGEEPTPEASEPAPEENNASANPSPEESEA